MLLMLSYVVQHIATLGACMSMRACTPRLKPRSPSSLNIATIACIMPVYASGARAHTWGGAAAAAPAAASAAAPAAARAAEPAAEPAAAAFVAAASVEAGCGHP